jgi:hypothetical protein
MGRKTAKVILLAIACYVLLGGCASVPVTRDSLNQAYAKRDSAYLARVSSSKSRSVDEKTRAYASALYRQLRKDEIRKSILAAKAAKDAAAIERMLASSKDPFFEDDLRAFATSTLTELKKAVLIAEIEAAKAREDLEALEFMATDTATSYRSQDLRAKAAAYLKELETKIAQREREKKLTAADARLVAAFESSDLAYLQAAAEGKNPGDPSFFDDAKLRKKATVFLAVAKDPLASIKRLRGCPLDPRVREIHPMIRNFISSSPEKYLDPLIEALVRDVHDPFEKAKLIHDWIADNVRYNFEGYCSGNLGDNSWVGVVKSGKSVCAGYANLYYEMCKRAGIKCEVVAGFAKGYGYDPLADTRPESNHAWNMITVQGKQYLLDVTWDSGYINGFGENVKSYSTEYLFADPGRFIYSHFPEDNQSQLLATPLSFVDFKVLPGLRGAFFDSGLELLTSELHGIMEASGSFELALRCPAGIILDATLRGDSDRLVENACFVEQSDGIARVKASMPTSGSYTLVIFGGKPTGKRLDLRCLLELVLVNHGAPSGQPAYPTLYADYYLNRCQLLEPKDGILPKGVECTFRLMAPSSARPSIRIGDIMTPLQRDGDGAFCATLIIPDAKELVIYLDDGAGAFAGIVKYAIR